MFYVIDENNNKIEAYDKEGVLALLEQAIEDGDLSSIAADSAFVDKLKCCVSGTTNRVAFVTQATYNTLKANEQLTPNTIYFITDDTTCDNLEQQLETLTNNLAALTTEVNNLEPIEIKVNYNVLTQVATTDFNYDWDDIVNYVNSQQKKYYVRLEISDTDNNETQVLILKSSQLEKFTNQGDNGDATWYHWNFKFFDLCVEFMSDGDPIENQISVTLHDAADRARKDECNRVIHTTYATIADTTQITRNLTYPANNQTPINITLTPGVYLVALYNATSNGLYNIQLVVPSSEATTPLYIKSSAGYKNAGSSGLNLIAVDLNKTTANTNNCTIMLWDITVTDNNVSEAPPAQELQITFYKMVG